MTTEVEIFTAYLDRIPPESDLADLCREIVQGEIRPMTDAFHPGLLEEGLALVAASPLWVWLCIELDSLRNRREAQEAERRIAMVLKLQEYGYDKERAERLVEKTLNSIRKRNKESPAIKSLLQIANTMKGLEAPSPTSELPEDSTGH